MKERNPPSHNQSNDKGHEKALEGVPCDLSRSTIATPTSVRIRHQVSRALSNDSEASWRRAMKEVAQMIVKTPALDELIFKELIEQQGDLSHTALEYATRTKRSLDGCRIILQQLGIHNITPSATTLKMVVNGACRHIAYALEYSPPKTAELNELIRYSDISLALLKCVTRISTQNTDPRSIDHKQQLALFYDLVVFDPIRLQQTKVTKWPTELIRHYKNLVDHSAELRHERLSAPLCHLWKTLPSIDSNGEIVQSSSRPKMVIGRKDVIRLKSLADLSYATLESLSSCGTGASVCEIFEDVLFNTSPHNRFFSSALIGLVRANAFATRSACETLLITTIETRKAVKQERFRSSLENQDLPVSSRNSLHMKIISELLCNYLEEPASFEVFFRSAQTFSSRERRQLAGLLKEIRITNNFGILSAAASDGSNNDMQKRHSALTHRLKTMESLLVKKKAAHLGEHTPWVKVLRTEEM